MRLSTDKLAGIIPNFRQKSRENRVWGMGEKLIADGADYADFTDNS
jgi:hypothetical protein